MSFYFKLTLALIFLILLFVFLLYKFTNTFDKLEIEILEIPKFTAVGFWCEKANPSSVFPKALGESGSLLSEWKRQRAIGVFCDQHENGEMDMFIGFVIQPKHIEYVTNNLDEINANVDRATAKNLGQLCIVETSKSEQAAVTKAKYKSFFTYILTPMRVYPLFDRFFADQKIGSGKHEKPSVELYDGVGVDFPGTDDQTKLYHDTRDMGWCRYVAFFDNAAMSGPWQRS